MFANWQEAVIYGKVKVEPIYCQDKFMTNYELNGNTLIMVRNYDGGEKLREILGDPKVIFINENDSVFEVQNKLTQWQRDSVKALILTDTADALLSESLEDKPKFLIHFDLPAQRNSWTFTIWTLTPRTTPSINALNWNGFIRSSLHKAISLQTSEASL